jgi:hypothetical protein
MLLNRFQLADVWTDDISSESYVEFLSSVAKCIIHTNQSGVSEWCDIDKICDLKTMRIAADRISTFFSNLNTEKVKMSLSKAQTALLSNLEKRVNSLDGKEAIDFANLIDSQKKFLYHDHFKHPNAIKVHDVFQMCLQGNPTNKDFLERFAQCDVGLLSKKVKKNPAYANVQSKVAQYIASGFSSTVQKNRCENDPQRLPQALNFVVFDRSCRNSMIPMMRIYNYGTSKGKNSSPAQVVSG